MPLKPPSSVNTLPSLLNIACYRPLTHSLNSLPVKGHDTNSFLPSSLHIHPSKQGILKLVVSSFSKRDGYQKSSELASWLHDMVQF